MTSSVKVSTMKNTSGLRPLGRAVLVEPYDDEFHSTMIEIPATARERSMMVEAHCVVIAVGPEAWKEERVPRAKPGDKVLVSKWCGHITGKTVDGKQYRIVNAEDIFCAIDKEVKRNG